MTKLEQVRQIARRYVASEGCQFAILNLNRFSPMYVVRQLDAAQIEAARVSGQLVELVTGG